MEVELLKPPATLLISGPRFPPTLPKAVPIPCHIARQPSIVQNQHILRVPRLSGSCEIEAAFPHCFSVHDDELVAHDAVWVIRADRYAVIREKRCRRVARRCL
jgi:hypothetical protein